MATKKKSKTSRRAAGGGGDNGAAKAGGKPGARTGKKPGGAQPVTAAAGKAEPLVAPNSPASFRARVRMYRHGLGDCFLVTFRRKEGPPFQMLIDCGVLDRDAAFMTRFVEHIRDTVRHDSGDAGGKAHLDVVVGTHEHKDHLSGFNQARKVFTDDFEFGAVWLPWTENLTQPEIKRIKETKRNAAKRLRKAIKSNLA